MGGGIKRLSAFSVIVSVGIPVGISRRLKPTERFINMRIPLLILFSLFLSASTRAQKIFAVNYVSQADVKVFVVKYESQADLKVYKVKYESQAGKNDGKWFFVNYVSQAQKKIFFVDYESQADVKVYFVDYESQAGWINQSKRHYFY